MFSVCPPCLYCDLGSCFAVFLVYIGVLNGQTYGSKLSYIKSV